MMQWICALAVVLLCHVSSASALAASDRSHLSSDPRVKQARALVERSRFDAVNFPKRLESVSDVANAEAGGHRVKGVVVKHDPFGVPSKAGDTGG